MWKGRVKVSGSYQPHRYSGPVHKEDRMTASVVAQHASGMITFATYGPDVTIITIRRYSES